MKTKGFIPIITLVSLVLAGCNQEKSVAPVQEKQVKQTEEVTVEEQKILTLAEQGFEIDHIDVQTSGSSVVKLIKDGQVFYGFLDQHFNWISQPTNEILEIGEFHDGLAPAAVAETREMIKDQREGKIWGFIDETGNWAVKPIYRVVRDFSNDVAIVTTIEEDRDDLRNARDIVIDRNGNEVFEIGTKYNYVDEKPDRDWFDYYGETFQSGYLTTDEGVYNTKGEFFPLKSPGFMVSDKIVRKMDNAVNIYSLDEKLVKSIPISSEANLVREDYQEVLEHLNDYGRFIVSEDDVKYYLYNLDGKVIYEGKRLYIGLDGLINDTRIEYSDDNEKVTGSYYDLNGQKLFDVHEKFAAGVFNGRYWIHGEEYVQFIDGKTGEVLIDESKKLAYRDHDGEALVSPIIKMDRRLSPEDSEMVDCLVNMETLQIVTFKELLDKK